jgi:hypothetical protein
LLFTNLSSSYNNVVQRVSSGCEYPFGQSDKTSMIIFIVPPAKLKNAVKTEHFTTEIEKQIYEDKSI